MENYERLKVVGRGAFGTVYLCRRKSDNRRVIVKQIPVEQLSKLDRQATLNEVKVLAMLHHPNIIEYYSNFIQDRAGMMIVMEYAAGGTLFDYLEEKKTVTGVFLSEEEISRLFAQIVLPMHLVHSRQILHRDLKTQNIFLTKNRNHVKIGDFGISKILASKSKAFTVIGTPCYISPELCEGKPYNQKSDVWALGCVLYEMCSLKRAFEAPTLPALVLKIMRGTFQPLPSHFSANLRQLLASMLELNPASRPSLAQIMAHPWVAATLYKLPLTLGALPCTAKATRPQTASGLLVPNVDYWAEKNSRANADFRSVSPFSGANRLRNVLIGANIDEGQPREFPFPRFFPNEEKVEITSISCAGKNRVLAAVSEGKVIEWDSAGKPHIMDGLGGITISKVAAAEDDLACFVTDRGILMTKGRGRGGRLGHGDQEDVKDGPKIVEALLGDEVVDVSCCSRHVCAFTSDQEVFVWGGKNNRNVPQKLLGLNEEEDNKIEAVDVTTVDDDEGRGFVAVTTQKGQLFTAAFTADDDWGLLRPSAVKVKAKKVVVLETGYLILDGNDQRVKFITKDGEKLTEVRLLPEDRKVRLLKGGGRNAIIVDTQDNIFRFNLKNLAFVPLKLDLQNEAIVNQCKLTMADLHSNFLTILYQQN